MLETFSTLIRKYSALYNVPEVWIKAVIMQESSGNPNAYRAEPQINDASYGLMQILLRTARNLGYEGESDGLYDPDTNINLGTKLLAELRQSYGDDIQRVYSAYNSGKPDAYKTSNQVASNVQKVIIWIERFLKEEPLIATSGSLGIILVVLLLWFWKKGKIAGYTT